MATGRGPSEMTAVLTLIGLVVSPSPGSRTSPTGKVARRAGDRFISHARSRRPPRTLRWSPSPPNRQCSPGVIWPPAGVQILQSYGHEAPTRSHANG